MHARITSFAAGLAFIGAPVAAQAQDCDSLRSSRTIANQRGRALIEDNPGTALVAFGCMVAAKSEYDQNANASDAAGTFAVCGGVGCGFTSSYQNCMSAGTEIIYQAIRVGSYDQQMRRLGCRR